MGNVQEIAAWRGEADAALAQQERDALLRRASNAIPDRYRAVLRMRGVEKMAYGEIAGVLGTTEANVRMLMSRARKAMLKQLKGLVK